MGYVKGASFELIEADVHLDVTRKIDFIIRRKNHYRGVDVEAEDRQDIGVQLTTSTNKERIEEKKNQLKRANAFLKPEDRLEEIFLVTVPIQRINELYERWKAAPAPGGPEKLWDKETKKYIFEKVLAEMLTPEEIEEQWAALEAEI